MTKAQQEVVDLMNDGWQLGCSTTINGRAWIQKGGCGRGGESKNIHGNTLKSLLDAGVVVKDQHRFPLQTFKLATRIETRTEGE